MNKYEISDELKSLLNKLTEKELIQVELYIYDRINEIRLKNYIKDKKIIKNKEIKNERKSNSRTTTNSNPRS
jgi:hypothetical protein